MWMLLKLLFSSIFSVFTSTNQYFYELITEYSCLILFLLFILSPRHSELKILTVTVHLWLIALVHVLTYFWAYCNCWPLRPPQQSCPPTKWLKQWSRCSTAAPSPAAHTAVSQPPQLQLQGSAKAYPVSPNRIKFAYLVVNSILPDHWEVRESTGEC